MDMAVAHRILEIVDSIPPGCVATYGQVAALAGSRSPRLVGRVLAEMGDDALPWHRVLRANGTPAAHLRIEQSQRLRAEGVLVRDGRVSLARYRWQA